MSREWWEREHNKLTSEQELAELTFSERMVLRKNSMMKYCVTKTDVVRYVKHLLNDTERNSQLTITIEREKSGDFYVSHATVASSAATGMDVCSDPPQTT